MQGPIPHPLNDEFPDLPPTPVLWVAMSDGMLRGYCFGHLTQVATLTADSLLQVCVWSFSGVQGQGVHNFFV